METKSAEKCIEKACGRYVWYSAKKAGRNGGKDGFGKKKSYWVKLCK